MPLFNQVIAQYLSPPEILGLGEELGIYVSQGPPESMARTLVEGSRQRMRLDVLFRRVKDLRPQVELAPNLNELIAATFDQAQMVELCRRLGLDSKGLGLDSNGLIGWGYDPYLQRKKAELAQENSDPAALLNAVAQIKPEIDLTAFGQPAGAQPAGKEPENQVDTEPLPRKPPEASFDNLDLTVTKVGTGYTIEAEYSRGGEEKVKSDNINLLQDKDVQGLLISLGLLQGSLKKAKQVGRLMRERLFPPDIWALFREVRGHADKYDRGLRIRLRIEPPEVGMLPWEYCFDKDFKFLALRRELPLVRYIEQPFIPDDVLAPRPTRVLLASAGPSDMDTLDVEAEAAHINQELQPLVKAGELEIRHIDHVKLDDLHSQVVGFRPHILHFIGHGVFDIDEGEGSLVLERNDGKSHLVSPDQLATLLRGTDAKVIILNACKTATHDAANAFMGIAPALVSAEVPAVIAMQFAMPDDTAARFARQIYHFLAMGLPLDRAITEARINIFTYDDTFWAVPVLFMRSQDGVIWQEREE